MDSLVGEDQVFPRAWSIFLSQLNLGQDKSLYFSTSSSSTHAILPAFQKVKIDANILMWQSFLNRFPARSNAQSNHHLKVKLCTNAICENSTSFSKAAIQKPNPKTLPSESDAEYQRDLLHSTDFTSTSNSAAQATKDSILKAT